jgi:hypothetical protein
MEVTLYLPYYDYNDGNFDVSNDYYSEDEYSNAMSKNFNESKDIVYNSVLAAKNGTGSLVQGSDGHTYKFGQKTSQSEDKVAFSKCEGILSDISGEEDTVDSIISKFASQKQFLEIVDFDLDTSEEEFETELSLWTREHNSINEYKDQLGDDWVLAKEPKRNLKVHFKNKANQDTYAIFEDCRIMDIMDKTSFVLFVEKISLVDN